jgi:CheY-specific phosphatase CheX
MSFAITSLLSIFYIEELYNATGNISTKQRGFMVTRQTSENFLLANTTIFARNVCKSIEDMTGKGYLIKNGSLKEESFTYAHGMTVFINYYGPIQGDYLFSMDRMTAAKLAGIWHEGVAEPELREKAETCNGMLTEVLNASVGQSICQLEKQFNDLNYVGANVVYGEIFFPRSMASSVAIEGDAGDILCVFSINLATLKIAKTLETTLKTIRQLTQSEEKK